MLADALAFARRDDDWVETVLIGGVLTILGFLVVPVILVNGYLLRVLDAAVAGDEQPPRFGDWVDLLVDGLLVWVIQFIYLGVPAMVFGMVVLSLTLITAVTTSASPRPGAIAAVGGLAVVAVLMTAVLVVLVAAYLLPAALANFARAGEFAAAFHLRTVARAAFSADYVIAMLLVIAVSIVLGFVGGLLVVVLVGFFVLFYLQVVVYHLFGRGFARGLGLDTSRVPEPAG